MTGAKETRLIEWWNEELLTLIPTPPSWKAPPHGWVKISFDGAFQRQAKQVPLAWLLETTSPKKPFLAENLLQTLIAYVHASEPPQGRRSNLEATACLTSTQNPFQPELSGGA
ncbi:conserved hypothetical protein [Ricinus communis]|uniref:Uncharacterized protein n=1 Tax=Ricinus communis TaxID=3988 RepID=B9SX97_RICCO|nr:conserved hypothetical protein [Ricinus communis]